MSKCISITLLTKEVKKSKILCAELSRIISGIMHTDEEINEKGDENMDGGTGSGSCPQS